MNLKEIQNLIKFVAKSGATEVKLEMNDVKITIKTVDEQAKADTTYIQQMPALAPQVASAPVPHLKLLPNLLKIFRNSRGYKLYNGKVTNNWYFLQEIITRSTCFCGGWRYN